MHSSSTAAIAVIGLACRYPGATTPQELWENILARRRQFRRIPDCRLPLEDYYDADKSTPDKTYVRNAAFIDGFEFDWNERRIPFSTVRTTDIVHWLALEVSLAAIADAGYTSDTLPGKRTGVIIGNTLTGEQTRANTMRLRWPFIRRSLHGTAREQGMDDMQIRQLERTLENRYTAVFPQVDEDTLAGGLSNTIAGRICNYLDLMGGGFTIDGACASSLLAVANAASRLRNGELDLAVAGGVDISLDPFEMVGFAKAGALTDGDMTVYDRSGKGFLPGEGCGFMVLKPLSAARQDGNPVYAVIHSWGISSDGGGAGIIAPSVSGQALAIQRAYEQAPYKISELDFIEGHGTGTTAGDRTELEAVARAMGNVSTAPAQLRQCGITSLKSIIGHTKAASGIGGLIKAVMSVNRRVIPPTAACIEPHSAFDTVAKRLYPVRFGRKVAMDRRLVAGVSAMGFGGINCHITLTSGDGPDDRLATDLDESALMAHAQESELLVIGAHSRESMSQKIADLMKRADGISVAEMADLAAEQAKNTTTAPPLRAAVIAGHPDDLAAKLEKLAKLLGDDSKKSGAGSMEVDGPDIYLGTGETVPRVGFLFPGQGSQQLNMSRMLVQRFPWAQSLVRQADRITGELTGSPISELVYRDTDRARDFQERKRWFKALSRSENAQPAICLSSMLWFEFFTRLGVRPSAVGGHSLGELTAFFAAGVFDASRILEFAALRGRAMSSKTGVSGAMASLECDEENACKLMPMVDGYLAVANINSPRQSVLSGETQATQAMVDLARQKGINARLLPVSGAFHSRLCADAARKVAGIDFLSTTLETPTCPIFSSIDGNILEPGALLNEHFSRQIRSKVEFISMIRNMAPHCDLMIEPGPGRVLTGLVKNIPTEPKIACLPVEGKAGNAADLNRAVGALFASGAPIRWDVFFENRLIREFIPADRKKFVVNPCENLPRSEGEKQLGEDIEAGGVRSFFSEAFDGVPEALANRYWESRGQFIKEMVKTDLAFFDPEARPVETGTEKKGTTVPDDSSPEAVQALLFRLVSETTGFSPETLSRESRLLDDLNLDSIKAGDLIARFAQKCGVAFPDPAVLANSRLGEMIDAALRLKGDRKPAEETPSGQPGPISDTEGAPADAFSELLRQMTNVTGFAVDALNPDLPVEAEYNLGPEKLKLLVQSTANAMGIEARVDLATLRTSSLRQIGEVLDRLAEQQRGRAASEHSMDILPADAPVWVRDFAMDLVETPYPSLSDEWKTAPENDWPTSRVLILHSEDTADLAELYKQHLFQQGAFTKICAFDTEEAPKSAADPSFSHLMALLPRTRRVEPDRSALLQSMIRMRANIVAVPPAAAAPRRRTTVAFIQFGGGFFGRDSRFTWLDCCGATALAASLHLERADLRVRVVDFCPAMPLERMVRETMAEMITLYGFTAAGYDVNGMRRTFSPRLLKPSTFFRRKMEWSEDDVILVTGGAKGITAACALAVARETGARMALVGRTAHPDHSSQSHESEKIRTLLDQYAASGLNASYFSCDMSDRDGVDRMIEEVTDALGPVTGIIHGAGLNRPRLTGQVKPEQAFAECAPKVLGLLHLMDALDDKPPKLIVGMGSIIGITGMPGNGWYGFSNEVMDIALRGFAGEHPETQAVDAAFSVWRDKGMGARMGSVEVLRKKGIEAIPAGEGVRRFLEIFIHHAGCCQAIVTSRLGGPDTWCQVLPEVPEDLRFLENRIQFTPGVEAVFSARLSLETDPYLKDHDFNGSYLFPTVFGLEAMIQVASHLTGRTAFDRVRIRDIQLSRPITVDPEEGADIAIRALIDEEQAGGETVVHAGIIKQGTGVRSDFFSAVFVFDMADDTPVETVPQTHSSLPLTPRTDLYRPTLLFQGERFQNIRTVCEIEETGKNRGQAVLVSDVTPSDRRSLAAFGPENRTILRLGDPFFTDTLLQSAALLVPQDVSLPVSIDHADFFPEFFNAETPAIVITDLVGRENRDLIYQVTAASENGAVRAKLSGYRLRIIEHHDEYPTIADLIFPETRDRQILGQALEGACRDLQLEAPCLESACIPLIHYHPRQERRQLEGPMLERLLSAAAERYDVSAPKFSIQWQDNGKPVFADVPASVLDVSLTHEDRTCLCVCAPGPVGCDLASVTHRSRDAWVGLLGGFRSEMLDLLVKQGDPMDVAGTRIWAATETLVKAGEATGTSLKIVKRQDRTVLFEAESKDEGNMRILTLAVRLTWGHPMILAVTAKEKAPPRIPKHLLTADYPGYEPLYETRSFEMVENGPQGQLVFVKRLPVTFQPSANLSRTIYFSNYIKWMGSTREASAWPVMAEMSEQFASGRWGGVTNYGHLKILGEGGSSDQVEILMWVCDNSGPENSTMTLSYDFRKMLKEGGFQRLAFCRLQTTWVEIPEPGIAKVAPYPPYYGQFIEDMCPQFEAPDNLEPMEETLKPLFDTGDDPVI